MGRTLQDLAGRLGSDAFVSVLDSALHRRRASAADVAFPKGTNLGRKGCRRSREWWDPADVRGRSMSPLETRIRLVTVDRGLAPDELQHRFARDGKHIATVDLWWQGPPEPVAEADGRAAHEPLSGAGPLGGREAYPFVSDRRRQNRLGLLFPEVRLPRFTWADVRRPERITAGIRAAPNLPALP